MDLVMGLFLDKGNILEKGIIGDACKVMLNGEDLVHYIRDNFMAKVVNERNLQRDGKKKLGTELNILDKFKEKVSTEDNLLDELYELKEHYLVIETNVVAHRWSNRRSRFRRMRILRGQWRKRCFRP